MNNAIGPIVLFLLLASMPALAQQPFILDVTPRDQTLGGSTATYTINVRAELGFTATVYLSASSPTMQGSSFSLSTSTINPPYTATATLTVKPQIANGGGARQIIIEGKNGPAVSRDTVILRLPGSPGWRVYNTANAPIGSNRIIGIDIDRSGLGWIRTNRAMMTFDGTSWKLMDTVRWSGTADNNLIGMGNSSSIAIDSNGAVWLSVQGRFETELVSYRNGIWTRFPLPTNNGSEVSIEPRSMAADGNGGIWMIMSGMGDPMLLKFDGTTWTSYPLPSSHGGTGGRYLLVVDTRNHVWIDENNDDEMEGLDEFDGTYWTHHTNFGPTDHIFDVTDLVADRDYHVWAVGGDGAVKLYADTKALYPNSSQGFPGDNPETMEFDRIGNIWTGSSIGLGRFNDGKWHLYTTANSGLPSNRISVLRSGYDNAIWVGTEDAGLAIFDAGNNSLSAPAIDAGGGRSPLSLPHPNPALGTTTIALTMERPGDVRLAIVDLLGREAAVPFEGALDAGEHDLRINTASIPSGAYFIRMSEGGKMTVRELIISH